ncbi:MULTISPECIES: iron-siderophore ABC transporter substrate-binding protein [unclassified Modestobacter]|uniref:iron-siderophore ABC transporter substrate-binding protein n=1 Tax=unclassified Modestobacter TaxID=2643866 RepID=UPI0022AA3F99|nr:MULTISPECIES: iron-siderophore ABC transporter substrate-binding protein [unclassified Modestobacter]MCZ2824646.1 iron-siderophore ABC transporter substrate-binding protein [Modestobacter sp. VKM Ac-2981]MCZ2854851.1 iron-siderophore ABC transporter substrate-binding protein [Modestobacter sp. VKM Ac-2982]
MRRASRLVAVSTATLLAGGLAACSSSSSGDEAEAAAADFTPITVEHAFGTTTIDSEPERVATVNWANHEVPLALGVVPVGMAAANFGDDDGDGMLPWVSERLEELGGETPVLFDETDGIDFEAVADTDPDVILAAYSGLTQEDYDTLSEIAPVVAYPEAPWATPWREMIEVNAAGMGMAEEGEELIGDIEQDIADTVAEHPELEGKSTMFLTHVDTADLSEVSYYTPYDTRSAFFEDLGLSTPSSVAAASTDSEQFSGTVSAEQVDVFDDVDIIVTYGGQELVDALNADPLLSQIPAVANGAIVLLPDTPLGTAANPTPLAISWVLEDYVAMLAEAADKAA